jgi:hypothetical protein
MTGGRTAAEGCSHRRRRRRARRGPDSLAVDQGIRRSRGRGECESIIFLAIRVRVQVGGCGRTRREKSELRGESQAKPQPPS